MGNQYPQFPCRVNRPQPSLGNNVPSQGEKAGCYNIFGSESKIELANEVRYLTEITVCVFEDPENKEFQFGTLAVENLAASAPTDFKTLTWITRYTSPSPSTNKATVTVSYRVDGGNSWKVLSHNDREYRRHPPVDNNRCPQFPAGIHRYGSRFMQQRPMLPVQMQ